MKVQLVSVTRLIIACKYFVIFKRETKDRLFLCWTVLLTTYSVIYRSLVLLNRLQTETIFEEFNSMSLSFSMSMSMSMPLSDGPSIVPSTLKSDIPSIVPSIVPSDAVSDRPSIVPKGGSVPVPVPIPNPEPLISTVQPTAVPALIPMTANPTQPIFIIFNPTIAPQPVQVVTTKVTLEKSNNGSGTPGVSKVGTAFIVLGAVVAAVVCGGLYLKRRRHLANAAAARSAAAASASTTGETASTANFSQDTTVVS
jgi:hypothetical protein